MKTSMPMGTLVFRSFCAVMMGPMQLVRMCSSNLVKDLQDVMIEYLSEGDVGGFSIHICCTLREAVSSRCPLQVDLEAYIWVVENTSIHNHKVKPLRRKFQATKLLDENLQWSI